MSNFVEIKKLVKTYGNLNAVDNIDLTVKKGQFISLLGPSGCGKTTTLRCLAGLEKPTEGEIIVDGEVYNSDKKKIMLSPSQRDIGMVFQSYAVWPHMNVFDNIAYGLKMHKASKATIKKEVPKVIELVGLKGLAKKQVTKLSGGQQQRVAVARALIYNPKLLLFDEPLSNLDAKLREHMRLELTKLQHDIGITSIYVTHDQAEAMVISDEIVVMWNGKIEQIGNAKEIYTRPKTKFVADFIGVSNYLEGVVTNFRDGTKKYGNVKATDGKKNYEIECIMPNKIEKGEKVVVFFRPESISIIKETEGKKINILKGKIKQLIYLGNYWDYRIEVGNKEIRMQGSISEKFEKNEEVLIKIDHKQCVCIKK